VSNIIVCDVVSTIGGIKPPSRAIVQAINRWNIFFCLFVCFRSKLSSKSQQARRKREFSRDETKWRVRNLIFILIVGIDDKNHYHNNVKSRASSWWSLLKHWNGDLYHWLWTNWIKEIFMVFCWLPVTIPVNDLRDFTILWLLVLTASNKKNKFLFPSSPSTSSLVHCSRSGCNLIMLFLSRLLFFSRARKLWSAFQCH
jgi:hypothetical protein